MWQRVLDEVIQLAQLGQQAGVHVAAEVSLAGESHGRPRVVDYHQVAQVACAHLAPRFGKRGVWPRGHHGLAHDLAYLHLTRRAPCEVLEHVALGEYAHGQTVGHHDQAGHVRLVHVTGRFGQWQVGLHCVQCLAHDVGQRALLDGGVVAGVRLSGVGACHGGLAVGLADKGASLYPRAARAG